MKRIHLLLVLQTFVIILFFTVRLGILDDGVVPGFENLHWKELIETMILPVLSVIGYILLMREIRPTRNRNLVRTAFLAGLVLTAGSFAAVGLEGSQMASACLANPSSSELCSFFLAIDLGMISNWLFITGFVLTNGALMVFQAETPFEGSLSGVDKIFLVGNGVFIGGMIFTNLLFEPTWIKLLLITLLAVAALELAGQKRTLPLALYYATAFWLGLFAVGIARMY